MLNLRTEDLEILDKYPIKCQENKAEEDIEVILKIYNPYGRGVWYVTEAEKMHDGKDYLLFGYVESPLTPLYNEYGYFTLSELCELDIPCYVIDVESGYEIFIGNGSLKIDRDFKCGMKMGEILKKLEEG